MSAEVSTKHVPSVEVVDARNTHTTSPLMDKCELHIMTFNRMTGSDCTVMCKLINTQARRHKQNSRRTSLSFRTRHHLCRQDMALTGATLGARPGACSATWYRGKEGRAGP